MGHQGAGDWRPCLRPPASAALLPCCHSNALRPPLQHPAAPGLDQETGTHQSPLPLPIQPLDSSKTPCLSPHTLPTASAAPHLPLPFSQEKGDAQCCPKPPSNQNWVVLAHGGVYFQGMEVMNCWKKKPRLGSPLYTRVVQWGNVTSSNTPVLHFWANI